MKTNKTLITGIIVFLFMTLSASIICADAGGGPLTAPNAPAASSLPDYKGDSTNLYTGDFLYSLPLLTVPGRGGLDYPISVSYKSGITLEQESDWVGLGWSLSADQITQSIIPYAFGIPDEFNPPEYDYNRYASLGSVLGKIVGDDPYYLERDGVGLKFNLDFETSSGEKEIISRDGTRYIFEEYERIQNVHSAFWYCDSDGTDCELKGPYSLEGELPGNSETKFLIAKILSPDYYDANQNGEADDEDYGNWIKFEYTTESYSYEIPEHSYNYDCGIYPHPNLGDTNFYACQSGPDVRPRQFTFDHIRADGKYVYSHRWIDNYQKKYLKSIETPGYKAVFSTSNRVYTEFIDKNGKTQKKLDSIKLYSKETLEQTQGSNLWVEDVSNAVETYSGGTAVDFDVWFRGYNEFEYGYLFSHMNPPVWSDRYFSTNPLKLKLHFIAYQQGEDIYLNEGTITITYTDDYPNNYQDLAIYLPEVNGEKEDEFDLYVGNDGSTYWDSALTEYAAGPLNAAPIKETKFVYDYSLSGKKLTLKEVKTIGQDGGELPSYKFEYYNDVTSPGRFNYDWWGYYNPRTTLFGTINQAQSIPWMWSLKKIEMPTGGEISTEYEQDTFRDIQNAEHFTQDQYGGGTRVKNIKVYDGINTEPITTHYYYDTNGDGTGVSTGVAVSVPYAAQTASYIESDYVGKYIGYNKVTKKLNNGEYGKVETNFITAKDVPDTWRSTALWQPDDCDWDRVWCLGYSYSDLPCGECPSKLYASKDYFRGYAKSEISYDSTGQIVKKTENAYDQIEDGSLEDTRGWTQLKQQNVTQDGVIKKTEYNYGDPLWFQNGLVQNTVEYNNDGTKRVTWNLYAAGQIPWNSVRDIMLEKNMLSQRAGTLITDGDSYWSMGNWYYEEYVCYNNFGVYGQEAIYPEKQLYFVDGDGNGYSSDPCVEDTSFIPEDWIISKINYYDEYGNILEAEDFKGNPSYIRYDELGLHAVKGWNSEIGSEQDPAWEAGYDKAGNVINLTEANHQTAHYDYDEFNRLESVKNPGETEPRINYEYYLAGESFDEENPNYVRTYQELEPGKVFITTTYIDGMGRELQTGITESPTSEIKTNLVYNAAGFLSEKSKPYKDTGSRASSYTPLSGDVLSSKITYKADPLKRLDKGYPVSAEPDVYSQAFYEAKDLELNDCSLAENCYVTLKSVDEEGRQQIKQLNTLGETVQVFDASNNKTVYEYDFMSNLKKVTNANSQMTDYEYDRLKRVKTIENPNIGLTAFTYDDNSNVQTKLDSNNNLITYEYDAMNRVARIDYSDESYVEYIYDEPRDYGVGRLTTINTNMNELTTTKTLHYDEKGLLIKTRTIIDGEVYVVEYNYDKAGNLIYEKTPDNTEIEYVYNNMNQLQSIKVNGAEKISYDYDAPQNPLLVQNIDYPNSQTDFTYTDRDRIESLHIAGADGEFKRFYGFDDVGNLIDEYSDLSASPSTQIGHYDYDDTYRLTGVTDFNDYYGGDMSYDYDAVGNIRQNNDIVYDYEEGNDRLSSDGTFDYEYDARGNLKTKTLTGTNIKTRYFYDYENRLSTVILPDGSAINYYYDADGSRVKKTDWEGTTIYIYDAKGNVVYEKFLPAE